MGCFCFGKCPFRVYQEFQGEGYAGIFIALRHPYITDHRLPEEQSLFTWNH